jgi:hypothetical protein
MVRIKGLAVRARLDYVEAQFGPQGKSRVVNALTPAHRELLRDGVLVSGWYPLALSDDILGCAERLLGASDGSLCREIGKASARKGLTGARSAFAAKPSPGEIAAKMARSTELLWQSYYDTGSMCTRTVDEHEIESELIGIDVDSRWMCQVLTGYIGAHIEVLGGSNVTVDHAQCRSTGAKRCIWRARWSSRE